jgi:hypothetical protein
LLLLFLACSPQALIDPRDTGNGAPMSAGLSRVP